MTASVYDMVKEIVMRFTKAEAAAVGADASIAQELDVDSIDFVAIVEELEETFDIAIDDESLQRVVTLGDLARLAETLRADGR